MAAPPQLHEDEHAPLAETMAEETGTEPEGAT
jgi:hypothetical protein